jgi:hypothetical protein
LTGRVVTGGERRHERIGRAVARKGMAASPRDRAAAIRAFEQAVRLAPRDPALAARLALERLTGGDIAAARASLSRRAAATARDEVAILKDLAWGAPHVEEVAEAESALRRAWPRSRPTTRSGSTCRVAGLSRLLDSVAGDEERSLGGGNALARAQEALGDAPAALATLDRAKTARRRSRRYDIAVVLAAVEAVAVAWIQGPTGPGHVSQAPILIAGPPRSCATLLDRILSSHAEVTSEANCGPCRCRRRGRRMSRAPTAEIIRRTAGAPAAMIGDLPRSHRLPGRDHARFTDKRSARPGNANRYRIIDDEALVADPEGQVGAALGFCGLDRDPASLDFHRNAGGFDRLGHRSASRCTIAVSGPLATVRRRVRAGAAGPARGRAGGLRERPRQKERAGIAPRPPNPGRCGSG